MNNSYRSIWNDSTGTFVAVPENAHSAGKKTSAGIHATGISARFTLQALAVSVMLAFGANALAQPAGGVVAAGAATISTGASSTTINQSTQNAIINWQSFNIASGQSVQFVQPNSSSIALNRVLGSDPSSILGSLSANGKVFLVNPNGILFGQGASVNVGGLLASTLDIANSDFLAGNYKFSGNGTGTVLNQGSLNADGGYVALLGANVSNQGLISAQLGSVVLAAGSVMTMDVAGDGLLNVAVSEGAVNALVHNGGLIRADGGQVLLTAKSAGSLLQSAVNNTGVIQAQTLENHNGTIRLLGGQGGTVSVSGTLDASGLGAGQTGGSVTATGHHVGLFGGTIKASGDVGGGTVLIGGDYQGKNPALQNASATYMSADARISADAVTSSNGGKVVLWADDSTRAYGSMSARGGAQGGDGGLIETSGHWLDVAGSTVNASAPQGAAGTWLLDPWNVNVVAPDALGGFSLVAGTETWTPTASGSTVSNLSINAILDAGTNVNIQTVGGAGGEAGTITVSAPITRTTPGALTTLTLTPDQGAGGTITVGAPISGSVGAPLGVVLAGSSASSTVSVAAPITTFGGNFSSTGTTFANAGGAITTAGGNVNILHSTTVAIGANVSTSGGNFISTGSTFTNAGGTIDTSLNASTGGSLTIDQSATVSLAAPLITKGGDILIKVGSTFADTTTIDAGLLNSVTIQPTTAAGSLSVGAAATGTLKITAAEILAITARDLILGRTDGNAEIRVGTSEIVDFGSKNVTIQQASGGIVAETNAMIGSGAMNFDAGTGAFTNSVAVNTTGAITITADDLVSSANIGNATAGAVLMRPTSAAQPVNIASGAAGLSITEAEVNFLRGSGANTGSLTIGSPSNSALMTVASVTPLAIVGAGNMFLTNGVAMNLAGPISAVSPFAAQTSTGDLTLASTLTTTNASSSAIVLNAGANTAAGTASGGNIIVASGTLGVTAPGRITLFTGSVADSTGVTALVGAGSGRFRYNSDESATNYSAALGAGTYAIYRERPTLTITADSPAAITYGAATPALTTALSGMQNGDTSAQALSTTASVAVAGPQSTSGNYTVGAHALTPSGAVDSLGYALSYAAPGSLTVNAKTLTGSVAAGSSVYGAALAPGAASLTGVIAGDVVTPAAVVVNTAGQLSSSGNLIAGAHPGIESVSGALGGLDAGNYTFAGAVGNYTVSQLAILGDITAANKSYDGDATATINARSLTGAIAGDVVSYTGGTATFSDKNVANGKTVTGVGLTFAGADAGNYSVNLTDTTTANITPAALTIKANNATKVYGQTFTPSGTAFSTPVAPQAGETVGSVTVVSPGGTPANAAVPGPYAITPSSATGGTFTPTNYIISYVDGAVTVTSAPLTITASDVDKVFGQAPALTAFSSTGLLNGNTIASVTETSPGQPATAAVAGSPYAITPSNASGGSFVPTNYTISYVNGVLTVTPAPLTITANDKAKTYGQTVVMAATDFTSVGLLNGNTIASVTEVSPGTVATAPVAGSPYAITPSNASGGSFVPTNYTISYVNGVLTVTQAPLTITANDASKVYGQTATLAPTAFTTTPLVAGETVGTVTELSPGTVATAPVAGSPHAITPSAATGGTFTATNYTINYVDGNLAVTPAPLVLTANDATKVYGTTFTPAGTAFTQTGLVNSDTVTSVVETTTGSPPTASVAGSTYPIVITPGSAAGTVVPTNYVITYVDGRLTVTPEPLTVTANDATKTYGQTLVLPDTAFTTTGLVNGDTVTSVPETSPGTVALAPVVGSPYAITAGTATGTFTPGNYSITYVDGNLTITPALLTITANDAAKVYGQTLVLAPTDFTTTGLVNGDTVTSVPETSVGTVASAPVVGSPYAITPGSATGTYDASNYTVSYVDGQLYVMPIVVIPPVIVPPVIVPPVDVPPVDVPPVDVPPVDVPPVDVPPVDVPPVDVPPVDVPPVVVPPVDVPDVVVLPDTPLDLPIVKSPVGPNAWPPAVVLPLIPPQLQTLTPPVVLPPVPAPVPVAAPPRSEQVEPEVPPEPPRYVAPIRPRKQDRN